MNNSGICIRELIEYFKIDAEDVIVFHDDLDVEFGKIKAKFGGSSAGHNGIASIDKFIGKDYSRVRIGIGKPKENIEVGDYVLQNFDEDEMLEYEKISKILTDSISILVEKKLDLFSSTVNNKIMSFKCGIVGLPNVGKSTLFNALTNSSKAQAANFPFCTIDPNVGVVPVPDERLNNLSKFQIQKKL